MPFTPRSICLLRENLARMLAVALRELTLSSPSGTAAALVAGLAIELGAASALVDAPRSQHLRVQLPANLCGADGDDASAWASSLSDALGVAIECSEAEELYEPEDWLSPNEPLRPQLIPGGTPLYIESVVPREWPSPPEGALRMRLLDSSEESNVFLAMAELNTLHASTVMILTLLMRHRRELVTGELALDYGCGSGVLAIAALRLSDGTAGEPGAATGERPVMRAHATDVVEAALCCARRNARLNGIPDARLRLGMPWELPNPSGGLADVAMANMLPGPLRSVAGDLAGRVRPGGLLFVTGFRESDLSSVRDALASHFEVPDTPTLQRGGWISLACRRTAAPLCTDALSASAVE